MNFNRNLCGHKKPRLFGKRDIHYINLDSVVCTRILHKNNHITTRCLQG